MSAERNNHREVQNRPSHSDHNDHARIDSNHLQRGANQHDNHAAQARGRESVAKHGFPDTKVNGANHNDRHFQPSQHMTRDSHTPVKGDGHGQKPADNHHPPKAADAQHGQRAGEAGQQRKEQEGKNKEQENRNKEQNEKNKEQKTRSGLASLAGAPEKDLLKTQTTKNADGGTTTKTESKNNGWSNSAERNTINKDKDGHVTSITTGTDQNKTTTNYDKQGRPTSETTPDGTRTWDSHGKVTSDSRQDQSNQNRPDNLKTTKNPDGSTTLQYGPGDGSNTKTTFDKNNNVTRMEKDSNSGKNSFYHSDTHDFSPSGNESGRTFKQFDDKGKTIESAYQNYDEKGNTRKEGWDDYKGNHVMKERNENGGITKDEVKQPSINYSSSWAKTGDGGSREVIQNGNNLSVRTLDADGKVNFERQMYNPYDMKQPR